MVLDPQMIARLLPGPAGAVVAAGPQDPPQVPPQPAETPLPPPMLRAPDPQEAASTPWIPVPEVEPNLVEALGALARLRGGNPELRDEDVGWLAANLDRSTGAPTAVRAAVAAAGTPRDRLNTLRARYTMAVPIRGTDNFVYLDPDTGNPILFDEDESPAGMVTPTIPGLEGARLRDLVDRFPEVAEFIGMGVVGGLGAASPAGLVGGGAAGAAVGGPLFRRGAEQAVQALTGAEDTRTRAELRRDMLASAAVGAGSTLIPGAAAAIGRRAAQAARTRALLNPRTLERSATKIDDAIRSAGGQSADDIAAAVQLADEGPAAEVYRLATRAPDAAQPVQQIAALRAQVGDDVWDGVASQFWMDLAAGQGGSSAANLATNYSRVPTARLNAIFAGTRYEPARAMMNDLIPLVGGGGVRGAIRNLSPAAKKVLNPLAGAGGVAGLVGGGPVGAAVGTGVGAGMDLAVSRALGSARFLRWVTSAANAVNRSPGIWQSYLIRLPAIAEAEPEIADALQMLYPEAFRAPEASEQTR